MPEGDTIAKVAVVLRRDLEGEVLTGCNIRALYNSERLAGSQVLQVETLGKHLLIHLDCELQLRVHLGMHGSWHRYSHGAAWKRSSHAARVVLETERLVLVCFNPAEVELIPTPQRRWHRQLGELGPDLLGEQEPDWDEILRRCGRYQTGHAYLGELLLDQRVAAGIGNVYKSELCFMGPLEDDAFTLSERPYSPWSAWTHVPLEDLRAIFQRARTLLQANLGGWYRTTRVDRRAEKAAPEGNLYVYGLHGKACPRCGESIHRGFQGLQNRVTYWCGSCQPSPSASGSA